MQRALLALLLWTSAPAPSPLELRVDTGRVELVDAGGLRSLTPRSGPVGLSGVAYAEAGALSEVELRWSGLASAEVEGPAALEVASGSEARLRLVRFQHAEVEVRRGSLSIVAGEACVIELRAGALGLRELPDGVIQLENRGGRAIRVRLLGASDVREVAPGASLRLRPRAPAA
jgi:hypothetical protein